MTETFLAEHFSTLAPVTPHEERVQKLLSNQYNTSLLENNWEFNYGEYKIQDLRKPNVFGDSPLLNLGLQTKKCKTTTFKYQ